MTTVRSTLAFSFSQRLFLCKTLTVSVISADLLKALGCVALPFRPPVGLRARSRWIFNHTYALARLKTGAPYRDWRRSARCAYLSWGARNAAR